MYSRLFARSTVFLFVRSHLQLQFYMRVHDTHKAANDRGRGDLPGSLAAAHRNVIDIHPRGSRL